jgi:hypothetical protein
MNRIFILLVLVACSAEDRRSPPPAKKAPPALSNATQADLATELDKAAQNGTWIEQRRRWQGQKLRWPVTRQRARLSGSSRYHGATSSRATITAAASARRGQRPGRSMSQTTQAAHTKT